MELKACLLITLVIFWSNVNAAPRSDTYCFSSDTGKPQLKHFTSKGAYQLMKGSNFQEQAATPNCTPTKIWVLSRHGTQLADLDEIGTIPALELLRNNIIANYKKPVAGGLCDEDLQLIKNWVSDRNMTTDNDKNLAVQGFDDLKNLGEDFKKAFPGLLTNYNQNKILLRHISTQISKDSYIALVEGLFGKNAHEWAKLTPAPTKDYLLRAAKLCLEWTERADAKKDAGTEAGAFKTSDAMIQTFQRISNRLGFSTPLKYKAVKQIWDICRLETSWYVNQPSAWCAAFTMQDILVWEYMDDLANQYASGHTFDMNYNIPCETMKDMLNRLSSNEGPNAIFYVSNSDLIQLFSTALGLQKDSTLLSSATYSHALNRKFSTSALVPMAANYAVVKYDCSADPNDPTEKIKFFLNQQLYDFEGCPKGFCKLADFVDKYKKYLSADCKNIYCTSVKL